MVHADCERVFKDEASGKDFDRPEWQKLCTFVREGDCVVVHDLSRLGRNARQIKDEWEKLMRRHVDIRILNMPILDTRRYQQIEGIVQLVFELLSWQVEEER